MLIRTIIYFTLSLLWVGPVYAADDDCVADIAKYTQSGLIKHISIFDPNTMAVRNVLPSTLEQYAFVDHMKLPNGVDVNYTSGGCAHYGYTFVFQGDAIEAVAQHRKIDRAIELLKSLPLIRSDERDILLRALNNGRTAQWSLDDGQTADLPCGDAECTLTDRDDHRIEISYSFPL
jgi:hypothetical protein